MATSIPYDHPSLVLGNIVDTRVLGFLHTIAGLQNKIDASHDKLNSHIALKRSLTMTISELMSLEVDTTAINEKINEIDTSITKAAQNYLDTRLKGEDDILNMREQMSQLEVEETMESPLDYSSAKVKNLPLSSESLKLDAQYFSYEQNKDALSNIENYVRESTGDLGSKSTKLAKAASAQVYQQQKSHNLSGTLVITASCTHKNVAIIEPFNIDVDKAIDLWNSSKTKKINTNIQSMMVLESQTTTKDQESISVISGAAYGSSFVGMVHVLSSETAAINPSEEVMKNLQEKIKLGGWIENMTGGFGVESSVLEDIKRVLNTHNINSHISLIVMGAVPSIASNNLMSGFKELAKPNDSKQFDTSYSTQNRVTKETSSKALTKYRRQSQRENKKDENLIHTLGSLDSKTNMVMDINSLMTAFNNYLNAIQEKEIIVGTPIHFYLKKITAQQVARLWIAKHYPKGENDIKTVSKDKPK